MNQPWSTAPVWGDYPVVIVGGGESVRATDARTIGMARARDTIRVITINDAVYLCWFADIAYAADAAWWAYHGTLPGFQGVKLSIEQPGPIPLPAGIDYMRNSGRFGFDPDPAALRTGDCGGFQTIHLAVHLGAREIILVGFDNTGAHWFGDHPQPVAKAAPDFRTRARALEALAPELKRRNVVIRNASATSKIDLFPRVDLATELNRR